jgi:hypothetical protein
MTFEDFHNKHFSIFSECPHILIQAAADPLFLNKCPGTPHPEDLLVFKCHNLRATKELQLVQAKMLRKKIA